MAEANDQGQITKAYGFNPNTQRADEEDEEEEGSLWSTEPIWQADVHSGSLASAQTRYHYITTDHLGTPILATDRQGNKSWRSYSEAFGHTGIEAGASTQINLRFPGQYYDAETGLHQNYFRDYSPARGRYIQSDPLGIFGGLNTYEYAYNDPLGYIDPTGEVPIAPLVWSYFRCVASCTARSSFVDALTGEVDCWSNTLTDNAQDCALSCANPLNWLGGKFNKALPKPAKGKGSVDPARRDKKRVWTKEENKKKLEEQDNKCMQCGKHIKPEDAHGHHIIRHADGGPTNSKNHAVVCKPCHIKLHK